MELQKQEIKNSVIVRSFNQIQIQPMPISSMFYSPEQSNLYVSREKSSEVYHITTNQEKLEFTHIARLPWSKFIIKLNSVLLIFRPFQLHVRQFNSWNVHSFTTQLLSIKIDKQKSIVYSFHQEQTIEWSVEEDDFNISYLTKAKAPYHLNKQHQIQGLGKKIVPFNKTLFTTVDYVNNDFIVAGDDTGAIHIYDYKSLGHLKTFKRHLGPILSIKIDESSMSIFFTGSDSKIGVIRRLGQDWLLSGEVRGQSHDIFSLEIINQTTLISGGLTTDLCCYPLHSNQQILQDYYNKISYSSQNSVHSVRNLLLINKITSFQIWRSIQSTQSLQFLVRYQLPHLKFIKDIKISKRLPDQTYLIIASSQIDTIGWRFSQSEGLTKLFTIKNSYEFIQFLPGKSIFIGLRDTGDIEKVHCTTGKIDEITASQVQFPTDMKLISDSILIIGSNLTMQIKVFDLKNKCLISRHSLGKVYQVICEKNQTEYLIKYVDDQTLFKANFSRKLVEQESVYQLPQSCHNIRYGGVIIHKSPIKNNLKRYWYFATENKVILLNNLNNPSKKKRTRTIYTRQIGTIFKPKTTKSFEIGVIHLNFRRMINQMQIKPLLAKKIV